MNKPQPVSPRRRLQALLAIPERDRTDEEWDEMNELEIMLAPGNRGGNQGENGQQRIEAAPQPHPNKQPGGGGPHGKRSAKQFHRRKRKNKGQPG